MPGPCSESGADFTPPDFPGYNLVKPKMPAPSTIELAFAIADDDSCSAIESLCLPVDIDGERWWSTSSPSFDENTTYVVARAAEYLEQRGLLVRHPIDATFAMIGRLRD